MRASVRTTLVTRHNVSYDTSGARGRVTLTVNQGVVEYIEGTHRAQWSMMLKLPEHNLFSKMEPSGM